MIRVHFRMEGNYDVSSDRLPGALPYFMVDTVPRKGEGIIINKRVHDVKHVSWWPDSSRHPLARVPVLTLGEGY